MTSAPAPPLRSSRRRRVLWIVGGLVVVGVAAAVIALPYVRSAQEVDAAGTALKQNDPVAALQKLDGVLARTPDDRSARLLAAQAARRVDAHAAAEQHLTAFEGDGGSTDATRLEWALLGVQQGDFGDEENRLRQAVGRHHPQERLIIEALTKGYHIAFRWQDALEAVNRLLQIDPDNAPALVLRAMLAEKYRRTAPAEEDLRHAVAVAPGNAIVQAALADFLGRHGHSRDAIYHHELALRLRPGDPATRIRLARALSDDADLDGAARELDAVLADDSAHIEALVERGRVALRRGQFAEAEPFLDRAGRAAPWHRDGHRLHQIALRELGRGDALAACEARIAEHAREDGIGGKLKLRARDAPRDSEVRMELWDWSVRNGQTAEGVAWLAEILRVDPKHRAARAAFAEYFERAGQPRRAREHRDAEGVK